MAVEIRRAKPDDIQEMIAVDYRNFGVSSLPEPDDLPDGLLDPDRFLVAVDGQQIVAAAGSYEMELTVPGGSSIAMSGVTWVSVMASHRRRGILRSLMESLDDLAVEFEEPSLGLTASEGPIYERFGYGIATKRRIIEIDRRRAQIDPALNPEPVTLVEGADHVERMLEIYDRYRVTQVGEVSRSEALFREHNLNKKKANHAALHPDGYAIWEVDPDWQNGHPAHTARLKDLVAVTPAAHLALWNLMLSLDLVGPIRSFGAVGMDDPLPYLLTDQRALRTVDLNDGLWLKIADAERCFAARSYRAEDRLVIGITEDLRVSADGSHKVSEMVAVSPHGTKVVDEEPDIIATRATLGPLLLGNAASRLAAGGRLVGTATAIGRADLLLGTATQAHLRTGF